MASSEDGSGQTGAVFVIDAFGAPWILDLSGLEEPLADSLRVLWSRAVVDTTTTELSESDDVRPFVVARSADGSVTVGDGIHHGSDEHLPYAVSRALTLASLKRRVGDCVLLHAAGAALPDGSTVALVGPSGTGKTTASRALCQTLGYVSDETVAVEESGRVRAWAKPLSVVIDPASRWEKLEHSPDELGLLRAPEALHLVAVIVLDRDPDLEGDPVLEQILTGGRAFLNRTGWRNVVGRDGIAKDPERAGSDDVLAAAHLALEERR